MSADTFLWLCALALAIYAAYDFGRFAANYDRKD